MSKKSVGTMQDIGILLGTPRATSKAQRALRRQREQENHHMKNMGDPQVNTLLNWEQAIDEVGQREEFSFADVVDAHDSHCY